MKSETGSIDCHGTHAGQQVTGPGSLTFEGMYGVGPIAQAFGGGGCAEGGADLTFTLTIPTTGGPVTLRPSVTFVHVGPVGPYQGTGFSGVMALRALTGDCVTSRLTVGQATGQGFLSG